MSCAAAGFLAIIRKNDQKNTAGAAPGAGIQNLYLLAPLPFLVIMPILYYFYKPDKIYPQVMADLEQREQEGKL